MPLDGVKKPCEPPDTAGAPNDAAMQTHCHHALPALTALAIEPIEGVTTIGEEVIVGGEVPTPRHTRIVIVERVGQNQMHLTADLRPIRQILVTGVAVEEESPALDNQATRIRARPTRVPTDRGPADGRRDRRGIARYPPAPLPLVVL
jgi:hypothetical protein